MSLRMMIVSEKSGRKNCRLEGLVLYSNTVDVSVLTELLLGDSPFAEPLNSGLLDLHKWNELEGGRM